MWQVTGARIFLHFCCCCFYPEFFGIAATIRTHQKIRFYLYAGFLGNNHSIQSCLKPWLYTLGCINTAFKPNPVCFAPEPVVSEPSSLFQSLKTVDCWDAQTLSLLAAPVWYKHTFPRGAAPRESLMTQGKFFRQPLRTFHCFSDFWIKTVKNTRPRVALGWTLNIFR